MSATAPISNPDIRISVLLCTYNGTPRLPMVLEALGKQRGISTTQWELIVVDNASKDHTSALVKEYCERLGLPLRLLQEPKPGKIWALRLACIEARGEFFAIVDDDNILDPDWLANAVDFLQKNPAAGLIGGKIVALPEGGVLPPDMDTHCLGLLAIIDLGEKPRLGPKPVGAGMAGRTQLFRAILIDVGSILPGRVGNRLGGGEDHELGAMVNQLGWETWYVPTLRLQHFLPLPRLNLQYIERLRIDAAECLPWLKIVNDPNPDISIRRLLPWFLMLRLRVVRYSLLSFVPSSLDQRLKLAPFWKRFYGSQACGVWALLTQRSEIRKIFSRLKGVRGRLSPQRLED